MPLFQIHQDTNRASRISSSQFRLERQLQKVVETNLVEIFGVQFVASEFVLAGEQAGRIDTLGLDLEGAPTIIEYKRGKNENVINQGLYYMNWLVDHRGDFVLAAQATLGYEIEVTWSHPRLIIIAESFAKWDNYAVNRMGDGIELWKYVLYGDNLLYFELVYGQQRTPLKTETILISDEISKSDPNNIEYTLDYHLADKSNATIELFHTIRDGILSLSDTDGEIIETPNKLYISYRHGKNFCEVQVMGRSGLKLHLDIPYETLDDPYNIARDVSTIGHWGTGDTEVKLDSVEETEYVLNLIEQAYRRTL